MDPGIPYLVAGYGAFFVVLAAYVARLWVAQRRLAARLETLETRDGRPSGTA